MSIKSMFEFLSDGCAHWRTAAQYDHPCGAARKAKPRKPFWMKEEIDLQSPPSGWTPRTGVPVVEKEEVFFFSHGLSHEKVFFVGSQADFRRALKIGKAPVVVEPGDLPCDWRMEVL